MATDILSPLTNFRSVPLAELDGKDLDEVIERVLGTPTVPVAAFNSAI